ncbi:nuclear RNA polymerase A1 [Actinidia rufa]|uniref:DNA-directed RNA polymerase subunit n=1 Tax=Actinidia rufa TaxID=165716 RepID=A0A7J0FIH8_9ERIC|nr:nuclear RNA polymerase A1 [Actinidia rufa]
MRSFVPAIYDVTVAIPKSSPPPTMLRLFKGQPSVVHVHLKRHLMKELPETDDDVAQWCKDVFVAKDKLLDKHIAEDTFGIQEQNTGRPLKSLVVFISWACLLIFGALRFFHWTSLLSSWKGIAFSAIGLAIVTVLMQILIQFSQSERSTPAKGVSESVEAVRFSFMKDEEVRRHSVVKITNPILLDSVVRPVPAGLYDPAMGPLDDHSPCKSCGQRSFHCPGHCGHIDLVTPVYNPLLFNMLHNLLQRTCFFCLHFRASRSEVEKRAAQLELIAKGDIVRAKSLDSISPSESIDPGDSDGSHVSCSTVHSAAETYNSEHSNQGWTSVQFIEAMAILNKFLKPRSAVCKNCNAKNPKISKPTFGWFHTIGLSDSHARANVIRGYKLGGERSDETEENPSPEVVNADETEGDSFVDGTNVIEGSALKRHERNERERAPREFVKQKRFSSRPLLPSEVRDIVKLLWENEAQLCSFICDIQHERFDKFRNRAGYSMFFMESVLVPPIKFRPAAKAGDAVSEHPQTVLLGKVLQCNIALGNAYVNNSERSKIVSRWMDLQQSINVVFDSKTATDTSQKAVEYVVPCFTCGIVCAFFIILGQGQRLLSSGICQLLEKKEGIFRQKMMGKRVNFACRSVISPDPYLAVNEIGVPPYFAVRLTYPERVTSWNVANLRDAIINGPEIHPGATHYVDKLSTVKLPPNKKMRISMSRKLPSSRGVVTQNGKNSDYEFEGKIVYRHLRDGDIVLVNRQPTLHKPSIMAHVVRVLKGEKTLRMHYANCNTYNADFDGDEMNVHLPQDEISRAEAYNIVNANHQYIVPTRGDTVRTLIQDHIVSAVLLTMKDTFLSHNQFNQLLYGSGVFAAGCSSSIGKRCQKISTVDSEALVQPVLPAIWKPKPLWTGKQGGGLQVPGPSVPRHPISNILHVYQPYLVLGWFWVKGQVKVITALLNHLTRNCTPFTVEKDGKIPSSYFGSKVDVQPSKDSRSDEDGEHMLLIRKNELVHGVIDKAQFGKYGLVHTVQELYGSDTAGILLSALSRLFTVFLQIHGFTCGVDDLLILPDHDKERKKELEGEDVGEEASSHMTHASPYGWALTAHVRSSCLTRNQGTCSSEKEVHRGTDDRDALLGKLPSLPPVHMLLDAAEGTARWSVQVLPLGLFKSCAVRDALRTAVLNAQCRGVSTCRTLRCPLALEPMPTLYLGSLMHYSSFNGAYTFFCCVDLVH